MKSRIHICLLVSALISPFCGAAESNPLISPAPEDWPRGLEWEPIRGIGKEADTRFGRVTVSTLGEEGESQSLYLEFKLDDKLITAPIRSRNNFGYVSIKKVFELGDQDIVLFGVNSGGSGSPPDLLLIAPITESGALGLLSDPALQSEDWTMLSASDGESIYFDLGYQENQRKTAIFSQNRIQVSLHKAQPVPLSDLQCDDLFERVSSWECTHSVTPRRSLSQATARYLRSLDHRPGFDQRLFLEACAESGRDDQIPDVETFKARVCEVSAEN